MTVQAIQTRATPATPDNQLFSQELFLSCCIAHVRDDNVDLQLPLHLDTPPPGLLFTVGKPNFVQSTILLIVKQI